jgi:microcystin-dependent protein
MEEMLGVIKLFGGNYSPKNFVECNGQMLSINKNEALFVVIGTQYGGDGATYFQVPKLESPIEGMKYIICINGGWPERPY